MWGVGVLKVHGICNCSLVYREVVKALSDYKKSYIWWCRNITSGDSTGSNQFEKYEVCVPPGCCLGERGEEGVVWFSVCGSL